MFGKTSSIDFSSTLSFCIKTFGHDGFRRENFPDGFVFNREFHYCSVECPRTRGHSQSASLCLVFCASVSLCFLVPRIMHSVPAAVFFV